MLETSTATPWTLTARWVFPADGPPLERGTVTISGDRILSVEPHGARPADYDLGNSALMPGLVNAHTHLDLSGMRGKCPPTDPEHFTDWLRAVILYRGTTDYEKLRDEIRAGIGECLRFGTTLIGDIAGREDASWAELVNAELRSVVFLELLGVTTTRAEKALEVGSWWLQSSRQTRNCRKGLSPHAPYSVRPTLFVKASWESAWHGGCPQAIHLAETRAELVLLSERTGPFVSFLKELGVWEEAEFVGRPETVVELQSVLPVLFVHCNYLEPATPIGPNASIVYCPRTHAAFGHPTHPFREFLARGVRVALGTDSLASNPDLDLLAEARFVHQRHPDVAGNTLLRMATLSGAEALGWEDETGSLTPGKSADLVVLPLPDIEATDPHQLILASALPVRSVLFRGAWTVGPERESCPPPS